jgi:hypothetical protein
MSVVKVRKNFLLDKALIDKAQNILLKKHNNLTEAVTLYLKAIVKEPSILEYIEESATKRTGSFIGMLDGKIGDTNFKEMRGKHHHSIEGKA